MNNYLKNITNLQISIVFCVSLGFSGKDQSSIFTGRTLQAGKPFERSPELPRGARGICGQLHKYSEYPREFSGEANIYGNPNIYIYTYTDPIYPMIFQSILQHQEASTGGFL